MSEGRRGRNVTYWQLESLWEILIQNKSLATVYNKNAQAREKSKRLWREAEQTLNAHGDGAVKDWKGWSKYWSDFKSRLKTRVASVRASHAGTGGGPADTKPLTEIELKFLLILGEDFGTGLPGARVDPFHEETSTEAGAVLLEIPTEHTSSSRPATPAVTSWLAEPSLSFATSVSAELATTPIAHASSPRPATPAVTSWLAEPSLSFATSVSAELATTPIAHTSTPRPATPAVISWLAEPSLSFATSVSAELATTHIAHTSTPRPATPAVTSWLAAPALSTATCVSAELATTPTARMVTISGAGATTSTPRPTTPAGSNTNRPARNSAVTPLRRVRRRDPVMTQEKAQVKLIEISQRREEIERENLEVKRAVLEELREIKNRLPLPPRDD